MALTPAERMKRYREKLKQNPEKHEKIKKKHTEYVKSKTKKIEELTEKEKEKRRKIWRNQKSKQKYKKNQLELPKKKDTQETKNDKKQKLLTMPRKRQLLTNRNKRDMRSYQEAYKEVQRGQPVRQVARMFDLNHVSLMRYKRKREQALAGTPVEDVTMGYNSANKVFSIAQETEIENYAMTLADIYFGLSTRDLRKMSYDMTLRYNLPRPPSWDANGVAGIEWAKSFLDRHPQVAIRCAHATRYTQATSFNKQNVHEFYDSLEKALDEHKFEPQDIYIVDETGIMAEQKPNRILAKKGTRPGALSSAERETLVTVTVAANAIGNVVDPMFTFTTENKPGWMQEEDLLAFLQHFQRHTKCSINHKVLLLLDNQASHVSIECIDYCLVNGIIVLSFPLHCSHKLQPLACSVYGPFKKAVNTACDGWIKSNPGAAITIYDIPRIVTGTLPQAVPQTNVQAGFRCTGIYPFNREFFSDLDFASSNVTEMVLVDQVKSVIY